VIHFVVDFQGRTESTTPAERSSTLARSGRVAACPRLKALLDDLGRTFRLHARGQETESSLDVSLGRWGTVYVRRSAPDSTDRYLVEAQPSVLPFASSVAISLASLGDGELLAEDGRTTLNPSTIARTALRGPVISSDAEARLAIDELRSGNVSCLSALGLYVRCFQTEWSTSGLREDIASLCVRLGLAHGPTAIEAAEIAEALGAAPSLGQTASEPEAEEAFARVREAEERFHRER